MLLQNVCAADRDLDECLLVKSLQLARAAHVYYQTYRNPPFLSILLSYCKKNTVCNKAIFLILAKKNKLNRHTKIKKFKKFKFLVLLGALRIKAPLKNFFTHYSENSVDKLIKSNIQCGHQQKQIFLH